MRKFLVVTPLLIMLSSCAPLEEAFVNEKGFLKLDKASDEIQQKEINHWWESFNDPFMNLMADLLLEQSLDIQIAQTRIDEARGILKASESGWFPSIDGNAAGSRGNNQIGTDKSTSFSKSGFDAKWEIDIFGQTRSQVSAAEARLQGRIDSVNDIKNIMIADLMTSIIEWKEAQEVINETESLIAAQDEQIDLLKARSKAGLVDSTFLLRAQAEQAQTSTLLPASRASLDAARFKVARLLAMQTDQLLLLDNWKDYSLTIPTIEQAVSINIEVIKNRPDLRVLRAEMLASQGDLAKAEADLWPRLSVGAFFGVQDGSNNLRIANNPIWSLSAALTAPILNFGRLHGALDAANAKTSGVALNYENGVLNALQETQTALSDYLKGLNAVAEQEKALLFRKDTVKLANERFNQGLTDMTDLTTAQSELNQAAITMIKKRAAAAIAYIKLQKALASAH
ncbi:MAG: oprN [Candidatus Midichloriaceae bacterium]|jgi:NodT family efflux transporter outer membrane factor (OMF) lipoprotein|nr:oprN [Candidatus Midichloriaceae bacterium]